jgi:hypothetical protein
MPTLSVIESAGNKNLLARHINWSNAGTFMCKRSPVTYLLIIALFPFILWSPIVIGQTSSTTVSNQLLVAGMSAVKPHIDGVWAVGEWDDANEYRFLSVWHNVNGLGEAYVRCKYDNSSLYWLIDVPSDDGSTYTSQGKNYTGNAGIFLDLNMDGLNTNDKADPEFIMNAYPNGTTISGFFANKPSWASEISAVQKLGSSPHSSKAHRVYEVSMPLQPLLQYNKQNLADNLPAINVTLSVADSYGNGIDLIMAPSLSVLEFSGKPVPEDIEPLIPLFLALLIIGSYSHKKQTTRSDSEI